MLPNSLLERRGLYWWPTGDYHCFNVIESELSHIALMMSFCKKFDCAVQAGGNVGMFPMEMAKYFKRVMTFEPDGVNFDCLCANTMREPKIFRVHAGLGDDNEKVDLCREPDNCGAHYVSGKGAIPVLRLDSYELPECDLLQLDVEGYEYKALRGAIHTIQRCRPVIVCEEKGLGKRYKIEDGAIASLLLDFDYKVTDKIGRDVIYTCK